MKWNFSRFKERLLTTNHAAIIYNSTFFFKLTHRTIFGQKYIVIISKIIFCEPVIHTMLEMYLCKLKITMDSYRTMRDSSLHVFVAKVQDSTKHIVFPFWNNWKTLQDQHHELIIMLQLCKRIWYVLCQIKLTGRRKFK